MNVVSRSAALYTLSTLTSSALAQSKIMGFLSFLVGLWWVAIYWNQNSTPSTSPMSLGNFSAMSSHKVFNEVFQGTKNFEDFSWETKVAGCLAALGLACALVMALGLYLERRSKREQQIQVNQK